MDPKDEVKVRIRAYLDKMKPQLMFMSVDSAMINVRLFVVGAGSLLNDIELRSFITGYYIDNQIYLPMTGANSPSITDSQIVQSVKKAVTTVIQGVDLKHGDGKINIAVTGLTAELKKGDSTISAGVSWGGTLKVQANRGNFYVSGELANDHWTLKLSYPEETAVPDISKLGDVFNQGEKAFRGIIKATMGVSNVKDIQNLPNAVSPYMKPVGDAAEAIQGIAKASPKGGLSFGFSIGSPDPSPGQTNSSIPGGIQITATLTYRF